MEQENVYLFFLVGHGEGLSAKENTGPTGCLVHGPWPTCVHHLRKCLDGLVVALLRPSSLRMKSTPQIDQNMVCMVPLFMIFLSEYHCL